MHKVSFSVDGEFVCNLARTWFWDEDKPYAKAEELLSSCLVTDQISLEERKEIARDILEGRSILKGINDFNLVDDGELIRPITNKLDEYRKRDTIHKIKEDMEVCPWLYVDHYSVRREISINGEELQDVYDQLDTRDQNLIEDYGKAITAKLVAYIYEYSSENIVGDYKLSHEFWNPNKRPFLSNGLYLLEHPEVVYEIFKDGTVEYDRKLLIDGLYNHLESLLDSDISDQAKAEIKIRNERYRKLHENVNSGKRFAVDADGKPMYSDEKINNQTEPDDFESIYGLIDKAGNYYSCGYGGHHVKAFNILQKNIPLREKYKEEYKVVTFNNALDLLYDDGWAILRNLQLGGAIFFDYKGTKRPTKKQIDTAFDHMIRFDEKTLPGIEEYMNN